MNVQQKPDFNHHLISQLSRCSLGLFIFLLLPLFFAFLGIRPIATPDEARYIEIPREMITRSDWIVPYLNGLVYFEKPPFVYWIIGVFQKLFSLNEYFLRLPIALLSFTTALGQYYFVKKYENKSTAIISTLILSSSVLWVFLSQMIVLDMPLTCLISLSLFCYYHSLQQQKITSMYVGSVLASILCALTILTKGLVGVSFIGIICILWASFAKQWYKISPLFLLTQLLIILIVSMPWHFAVAQKHPDFWNKYFYVEHFLRYTSSYHRRYQPFWFFIPIIIAGFIPWIGVLFSSLVNSVKEKISNHQQKMSSLDIFLYCWIGFIFIFFSLSSSKLIPYILPLFPPLSIMLGKYIYNLIQNNQIKKLSLILGTPALCLAIIFLIIASLYSKIYPQLADINDVPVLYFWIFSFLFLILSLSSVMFKQQNLKAALTLFLVWMYGFHLSVFKVAAEVQKPSMQSLCQYLQKTSSKEDKIWMFTVYFQDVPLFLKRIVTTIDYQGELEYGMRANPLQNWIISSDQWKDQLSKQSQQGKQNHWIFTKENKIVELIQKFPFLQLIQKKCHQNYCLIHAIQSKNTIIN